MSKRSADGKVVLNNRVLTDLISSTYEKYVDLKELYESDSKLLLEILRLQEDKQNDLARIVELQEELIKSKLELQRKDHFVLKARVSLLEGIVRGKHSDLALPQEASKSSSAPVSATPNPFEINPFSEKSV